MRAILKQCRNFIIDMDGVLWRGETGLPGLREFFDAIRMSHRRIVLATNNSSRTVSQYMDKLKHMGVKVTADEILTSAQATASYLANNAPVASRVSIIGSDGLQAALREHNYKITDENPEYVVVGLDLDLNLDKLNSAVFNISTGAVFVGTNADVTYPTENGIGIGNGAILAALQAATGVQPIVIGKPEPQLYEQALQRLGARAAETLVIGDKLETDILGASRSDMLSLLVLTGVTSLDALQSSEIQPDLVFPGLPELTAAMLSEADSAAVAAA